MPDISTGEESILETRFIKIGNDYINAMGVERCLVMGKDDVYISMRSGHECTLSHVQDDSDVDYAFDLMRRIARKINEKAHDVIYIEAYAMNDEEMFAEDKSSNLLYRRWLASKHAEKPEEAPDTPVEVVKDSVSKLLKLKNKDRDEDGDRNPDKAQDKDKNLGWDWDREINKQ